jgi:hypothetical protein
MVVKLLLATSYLGIGGSESYLLTVAEHLDRLGHEAVVYSPEPGRGAGIARERALTVIDGTELPTDCDAALVQDSGVSLELASRCPGTPQVFVAHSESFNPQTPPQLDEVVSVVVALNDRVAKRLRSFALEAEVVRLRQPIDTERFVPRGALPDVPRRALLLSNNYVADRLAMLESACAEAGLKLVRLGGTAGQSADPRETLFGVDIVIGYGRSILEAMACGRAAYVYDWNGGDGWITVQAYPEIEADGIAGRSDRVIADAERLSADLRRYEASMGPVNHDIVMAHHRANVHVQQLLELCRGLAAPASRPSAPLQEMARLVRLEWRARADLHGVVSENVSLRSMLAESEKGRAQSILDARESAGAKDRAAAQAAQVYETTLSWRLTAPLRTASRMIRQILGR